MLRRGVFGVFCIALIVEIVGCATGSDDAETSGGASVSSPMGTIGNGLGGNAGASGAPMISNAGNGAVMGPGMAGGSAPPAGGAGSSGGAGMVAPPPPMAGGASPPPMAGGPAVPMPEVITDPIIPAVTADCPDFRDSTITYMGLYGIQIVAGAKPAGATAPMVFYWHGTGGSSGEFALQAGAVSSGVVAEGGVLVSFQDTTGGDLNSGTFIFGATDLEITDQLLACAVRDHNVDPRRVFATGCSAGGLFSDAMGALRSSYMAAVASNSGGFPVLAPAFQNGHTPALMTIHGAPGVDVVAIDFSEASALADSVYKGRGGFVINCNHNGIHCGGGGLAPDIWNFFKAHPFGVDPEPWSGGLPAGFNSVCQIQ